jgi:lysozyme family protein
MMRYVLRFEGGYTLIDPGGTNYGIMQCNYDSYRVSRKLKKQSVLYISMDEVYDLYYNNYYLRSRADTLKPCLCFVHFDTAINCGIAQADKFIRKVQMLPDKDNAIKYIALREQLYHWLAIHKNKGNVR